MVFNTDEREILTNGTLAEKQALLLNKIANHQFASQKAFIQSTSHHANKYGYEWFLSHHIQIPLENAVKQNQD